MNTDPFVTIITATYNADKFIEDSIKSVLNQTYTNYEYIIIDGASSDGTIEILKRYNDKINHWQSEPDSGLYQAWNKGLEKSKGEWIIFLGADDQLLSNTLETYVNFIKENSKVTFDYISSKVQRVNLDGSTESIVGRPWEWETFKKRMTTAHPGSFHSRKLFNQYGNYNTQYRIVSDYEILLRPRENLKAGFIDSITVLMSTGGSFNALDATWECLRMFRDSDHLGFYQYNFHKLNVLFRTYIKKLLFA